MIKIKDVSFSYPNFKIEKLNLTIDQGEIVAVCGNNGSGKTTLLKLISGHLKPQKGEVLIDDIPRGKSKVRVGVVFQNPDNQIIFNNVNDDICFTLKNYHVPKQEFNQRVTFALETMQMSAYQNSETMNLSTGQKQRIVIANMLAIDPQILLFDEATAYLDSNTKQLIYELFGELKTRGVTVIFTTNQLDEVAYADRVLLFEHGQLAADKNKQAALQDLSIFRGMAIPLKLKLLNLLNSNISTDDDLFQLIKDKL